MNKKIKLYIKNFDNITKYYNYLIKKTKNFEFVGITNEWLIDNYYQLIETKNFIISEKNIINKKLNKAPLIFDVIKKILIKNNYNISFHKLVIEVNKYQRDNNMYFKYKEIDVITPILNFLYIDKLNNICITGHEELENKKKVSNIINNVKTIKITDFFNDKDSFNNYSYIFEINNQLKELGSKSNSIFRELNEILNNKGIKLKRILNDEYQRRTENDVLISNIFNSLKNLSEFGTEEYFKEMSFCEKMLNQDIVYKNMTAESKNLYRNKILVNSKKKRISEFSYIELIMKKSLDENKHVGFYLFKEANYKLRFALYLSSIILVTMVVCFILSKYLTNFRLLGFLLLIVPISQIFIQILNQIISNIVTPKPLPKINFNKGIPKEEATMVVVPTIIDNEAKIAKVFDLLETYYLANKTKNLYFTLLGDVKASDKEVLDIDSKLSEYGCNYCEKLNKKYKIDIFNFVYRKRIYNEKESCYLGYERKRGALLHFNQLLLGKLSKKDEEKYLNVHTFDGFNAEIKYVITLDVDTKPVLNTLINLVGTMAHPLNKPVLNKEGTKVVKGYGILQPRVSVDIEATNKSLYSQIFAGIGGYDIYTVIVPNLYQDIFNEGSFIGKGIYDLKLFDKLLYNKFPNNLILSHDLLEGNYLRCGYVADLELIDDFPPKFLIDTTRQHRWARGDTQIIGWLNNFVRNKNNQKVKNPISLLGQYKILDNISRMFLYPSLLLILLCSVIGKSYSLFWFLFVIVDICLPIIFFLNRRTYYKKKNMLTIYYSKLMHGFKSLLLRTYVVLVTIPFYSKLYMDAFFRTIYRLIISKRNLLNWITAEEAEKVTKNNLSNYIKNFSFNIIIGSLLLMLGIIYIDILMLIIGICFISAPFVLYRLSKIIDYSEIEFKSEEILDVEDMAYRTWKFFEAGLKEETNYLIPDNYQENRDELYDYKTSPTNIGFSLTSVICAYKLGYVDREKTIFLITNIIETVGLLEKWNGHLYNWYDIRTKEVIYPLFISTVDSGNFIASLIVTNEFLIEENEDKLSKKVSSLIKNADFKKLYTTKDVFSIGYDVADAKLSVYNYNRFASESRLTSYVAIAKNDIPSKHWFCLDKSLTIHNHNKGLIAWSGTAFEYYMPLVFMNNYHNTLLDESYEFAHFCQKEYISEVDTSLPWGISESAYNELDNALNYKYKTFSIPYLRAKETSDRRVVISPYSSILAIGLYQNDVYNNLKKFKKLNMYSDFGFYEAYDTENKGVVKAYYAHHQGMILASLTNLLKQNVIKNYFHKDPYIKAFEILLKERVQIKTSIDIKIDKYKKYNYEKECLENDIRVFDYISDMPEVSVLSNRKYCLLMNDRGSGFSRYRTIQLNRYRKVTEQDYGMFLYIKDLDTKKVWSNTYAPINVKPDKYQVIFASDKIKYVRIDDKITTKTEIIVTKDYNAEIRKIDIKNDSNDFKRLELTTYTEPTICENSDDVSHKVFNNMFLRSEYDVATESIIVKRVNRKNNIKNYMINRLLIFNPLDEYQYTTDRLEFIGRNNTTMNPDALNKKLSGSTNALLEPIVSLRNSIEIAPGQSKTVYMICGYGKSREQVLNIVNSFSDENVIEKSFELASLMNIAMTKKLNLTGNDMRIFNTMLNYLYQTTKISINDERIKLLRSNKLTQKNLWKFGISGDRPIILVNIHDISDLNFVRDILKCFEYYKSKSIFVDIIIINSEVEEYASIIKKEVDNEIYRMYTLNSFSHIPGTVYLINDDDINEEEMTLLQVVPRLKFDTINTNSLAEQVSIMQSNNKINTYIESNLEVNNKSTYSNKLTFENGYGGFSNDGREYIITNKNTPTPWSNVIANQRFGTVVTNNGCGFTFGYNSGEYKLTSWTNDTVLNDKSEGIKIDNKIFDPTICKHGFGYSVLCSENRKFKKQLTEFVALEDTVKLYVLELTNLTKESQKIKLSFWINPTLGNFEEKTTRHILTEFDENNNCLSMRNVYSINYSNINTFMSSNEQISYVIKDRVMIKEIGFNVTLLPSETKSFIFSLGCAQSIEEQNRLVNKYNSVDTVLLELDKVKEKWNKTLHTIQIETPDKSLNYVLNGWYLYQALSSRIMGRTGFYQVSGAFGYRDQLQDAMNTVYVNPKFTRNQIIKNAKHQFIEGDVLHWWLDESNFGLRSKYKDDYLWLVYATIEYINITNDYDILKEQIPFVEGDKLYGLEDEKGINFTFSKKAKSLLDHCLLSIDLSMSQIGNHGLPLMGGGDWNDGMNRVGIKGTGESVWLGFFLYDIINRFIDLIQKYDSKFNIKKYQGFNKKLEISLNTNGWDNDYYLRAYFDNGQKLGSKDNLECKIDLISQSFSILSGVAPSDRISKVIESVENNLVDKKSKIIKLLDPPFELSHNNPGYIMNYPKGIRENGGQYTHSTAWYIMALLRSNYIDKAYEYYQMINPINRTKTEEDVNIYKVEPYVVAADIYSAKGYEGRGGWTWYTGSAGWFYRVGIKEILGFNKNGNILTINPNIPKSWTSFKINYNYINTLYNIEVIFNKNMKTDNVIKLVDDGKTHNIKVYIGE